MKRNEGESISSVIAAAVFALMAGCASMPSAEVSVDEFQADYLADVKP
jgi:type IV pilus biogenesis protein CpaD/CtpE